MSFRTVEISNAAEIHIRSGQLEITKEEGASLVPMQLCKFFSSEALFHSPL